ncbi:hypothetical protein, partial [Lelliottia nimipressuralis]|uniref:hypothetical protein n=1 Tax=Lelliottia nimipressuralis TaxID=69220 RepID=UPI001E2AB09A
RRHYNIVTLAIRSHTQHQNQQLTRALCAGFLLAKENLMKLKSLLAVIGLVFVVSASAYACPKGEHPHGGTGSHHKGGYCSYE